MENSEQCIEIAKMELNSIDETIKSKQATLKTIVNTFILLNSGIFFLFFKYVGNLKELQNYGLTIFSYLNFFAVWALISLASRKLAELYSLKFYKNRIRRKILKTIEHTSWEDVKNLSIDYLKCNKPAISKTLRHCVPYILATYNFALLLFFNIILFYNNEGYCIWWTMTFIILIVIFYPNVCTRFWIRTVQLWGGVPFNEVDDKIMKLHKSRKTRKKLKIALKYKILIALSITVHIILWSVQWYIFNNDVLNYDNKNYFYAAMTVNFMFFIYTRIDYEFILNTNKPLIRNYFFKHIKRTI